MKQELSLTNSQEKVYLKLIDFINDKDKRVFILKGYAGTGKTTITHFLIKEFERLQRRYLLLASTGRASKVLANLSGSRNGSQTIHSLIYKFKDFNQDISKIKEDIEPSGQLLLVFEPSIIDDEDTPETIYIIDEASMVSDVEEKNVTQASFGSGRLLKELLDYDKRSKSKFIFVGDPCQLPPIEEYISPALSAEYFEKEFGMHADEAGLTEIIRQSDDSSIISASSKIRKLWDSAPESDLGYGNSKVWGFFPFRGYKDILLHHNITEMIDDYFEKIKEGNFNNATYICRSNKKCNMLSKDIRLRLGFNPGHVCKGDLLMVIQNNLITGLMNGDMVTVDEINEQTEIIANLTFRRITVTELFTGKCYTQLLIEDTLNLDQLNLNSDQQKALFVDFARRMNKKGIKPKSEAFRQIMRLDPILNALRCTYGYATTCHKAQGGEWDDVYVDVPRNITLNPTKATYQWIYTAMTRAKNQLHMVDDFYIK